MLKNSIFLYKKTIFVIIKCKQKKYTVSILCFELIFFLLCGFHQDVSVKGEPGSSNLSGSGLSGSQREQQNQQVAGSLLQLYLCIDARVNTIQIER